MRKKEKSQAPRTAASDSGIRIRRTGPAERQHRDRSLADFRDMLKTPMPPAEGDSEHHGSENRRWVIRSEWEKPDPSTIWRGAGGISVAIAATAILAALTVSKTNAPKISLPWVIGAAALVVAGVCLVAHLDVNRGRRAKRSEIIEEHKGDDEPRAV